VKVSTVDAKFSFSRGEDNNTGGGGKKIGEKVRKNVTQGTVKKKEKNNERKKVNEKKEPKFMRNKTRG